MASLVAAVEQQVGTDYALLYAAQDGVVGTDPVLTYAATMPGLVSMVCGVRYADAHARVERWDGRPPEAGPEWEDSDELPWAAVPGRGPLRIAGFDPPAPDAPGLDVDGLDRARVQVLAAGRHRYPYGDLDPRDAGLGPERWLLRVWPVDGPPDPLAGPPRRIAGALPHDHRRSAWAAALHAWEQAGWHPLLAARGFREVRHALLVAGRPCAPEELGAGTADAVAELERLGLLGRAGGLLVPNPAPPLAWEAASVADARAMRYHALRVDYQTYESDLLHLLRWAGSVTTTPRRLAVRLALRPDDVLGTLRLLAHTGRATVTPDPDDADTELTVTA